MCCHSRYSCCSDFILQNIDGEEEVATASKATKQEAKEEACKAAYTILKARLGWIRINNIPDFKFPAKEQGMQIQDSSDRCWYYGSVEVIE